MENTYENHNFDPSGIGLKNGNFIGLPFTEETAGIVLLPVPWDVTVSFAEGTAFAPGAILEASSQLDLYDADIPQAWKLGIFMQPVDQDILNENKSLRAAAISYIKFLEEGGLISESKEMQTILKEINEGGGRLNKWVYNRSLDLLKKKKLVGIVGGDHSVPLGYLQALSEIHSDFGILQIDAHHDLRESYEGFTFSHASIFYNALKIENVSKLVQVGIRDYCEEEVEVVKKEGNRISVFYDQQLKENAFNGMNWNMQCEEIISELPGKVYVSFDIDGLDPKLCPGTGTPVPGGIEYAGIIFLLKKIVESGRKIIGFDLCEVGNAEWDANVAARILYKLCNLTGRANKLI